MLATESLRRDHALIEKMINALKTISLLLKKRKQIPDSILNQAFDFAINFTNTCHHGKEEESLFPTLEKKGMPREGGPIARMLYEHEITKELANSIVNLTKIYISSVKHSELVKNIDDYVQHVSLHLTKENQRLFGMADMLLSEQNTRVNDNLTKLEKEKLAKIGNSREYYEKLIDNMNLNE